MSNANHYQESQDSWGDSPYLVLRKVTLRFLTPLESIFWHDIYNYASMDSAVIDDEGYFLCTTQFLETSTMQWTRDQQKELLKSLQKKGLLRTKRKGIPGKRWVFLDYKAVQKASTWGKSPHV
jgi:hypothetical protein